MDRLPPERDINGGLEVIAAAIAFPKQAVAYDVTLVDGVPQVSVQRPVGPRAFVVSPEFDDPKDAA
jgi:hypothetical protein